MTGRAPAERKDVNEPLTVHKTEQATRSKRKRCSPVGRGKVGRARIVDLARVPVEAPTVRVAVGERVVEVAGLAGIVEIDEPVLDPGTAGEILLRRGFNLEPRGATREQHRRSGGRSKRNSLCRHRFLFSLSSFLFCLSLTTLGASRRPGPADRKRNPQCSAAAIVEMRQGANQQSEKPRGRINTGVSISLRLVERQGARPGPRPGAGSGRGWSRVEEFFSQSHLPPHRSRCSQEALPSCRFA